MIDRTTHRASKPRTHGVYLDDPVRAPKRPPKPLGKGRKAYARSAKRASAIDTLSSHLKARLLATPSGRMTLAALDAHGRASAELQVAGFCLTLALDQLRQSRAALERVRLAQERRYTTRRHAELEQLTHGHAEVRRLAKRAGVMFTAKHEARSRLRIEADHAVGLLR